MRVCDVSLNTLNVIANQPDVLVYINPTVPRIDLKWVCDVPDVLVKGCEDVNGAVILVPYPDNTYEIHWLMPCDSGLRAIRAIVDWVFERTNTNILFGPTPTANIAARSVNRWLGGRTIGEDIDAYGRPIVIYALSRDEWAAKRKKPQS